MTEEIDATISIREPTPAQGSATASTRAASVGSGLTGVIRGTGIPQPPPWTTAPKTEPPARAPQDPPSLQAEP